MSVQQGHEENAQHTCWGPGSTDPLTAYLGSFHSVHECGFDDNIALSRFLTLSASTAVRLILISQHPGVKGPGLPCRPPCWVHCFLQNPNETLQLPARQHSRLRLQGLLGVTFEKGADPSSCTLAAHLPRSPPVLRTSPGSSPSSPALLCQSGISFPSPTQPVFGVWGQPSNTITQDRNRLKSTTRPHW